MSRTVTIAAILMLACAPAARAQSNAPVSRSPVVWTRAAVGAAVGGIAGYLVGRARHDRGRPSTARAVSTDQAIDPMLLRELVQSVRFARPVTTSERRSLQPTGRP